VVPPNTPCDSGIIHIVRIIGIIGITVSGGSSDLNHFEPSAPERLDLESVLLEQSSYRTHLEEPSLQREPAAPEESALLGVTEPVRSSVAIDAIIANRAKPPMKLGFTVPPGSLRPACMSAKTISLGSTRL
jgi:hypothetical protein